MMHRRVRKILARVKLLPLLKELLQILLGTALMAVSLNVFLVPNKIAAGGISGLGVILFHLLGISPSITVFAANVPLFVLAVILLGWRFVVRSVAGALFFPLLIELTGFLPALTSDLLLASIYGGVGTGVGLGLIFFAGGSTGGTALMAQLLTRLLGLSSGQGLLGSDLIIVAASGLFFGPEFALYALLSLFVSSKVVDLMQEGFGFTKAAIIITEREQEVTTRLLEELQRGATLLKGQGAFTRVPRGVIFCVITQPQVTRLKKLTHEVDPRAFIVFINAGEVLGEGFRLR